MSVLEPDPPYRSGPVSKFISVSEYDPTIDGFYVSVNSDDPVEGDIRTFVMNF